MTVHHDRRQRRHSDDPDVVPGEAESRYPPAAAKDDRYDQKTHPTRRQRQTPIRVATPAVAAMGEGDQQQAVTALATMIAAWWHDHQQRDSPNLNELQTGASEPGPAQSEPDPPSDCED